MMSNIAFQMAAAKHSYSNLSNISNIPNNFVITPNSGSMTSQNFQNLNSHIKQPNMMKIIRGGNSNTHTNNNLLVSKMINSGNNKEVNKYTGNIQANENLVKLKIKKTQEIKNKEIDDLNNSGLSDAVEVQKETPKINSSRKEKGGILGFFSKFIPK